MKKIIISGIAISFLMACQSKQHAGQTQMPMGHQQMMPSGSGMGHRFPASEDIQKNQEIFSQYCIGEANSTEIPKPNYDNPLVKKVTKLFDEIAPNSFYLYPAILRMYKLPKATDAASNANNFFVYLCGEFRDRATMIEAKLKWFEKFNKLKKGDQRAIDPSQDVWMQMTANAYRPYIIFTSQLWRARQEMMEKNKALYVNIGKHESIDLPVPGVTVCETKYIFSKYISKKDSLYPKQKKNNYGDEYGEEYDEEGNVKSNYELTTKAMEKYNAGYESYKNGVTKVNGKDVKNCTVADTEDYYDFRGDSNYKPNSPESNGMIWYTLMMAQACKDRNTAGTIKTAEGKVIHNQVSDETCQNYFKRPFYTRYEAARAGLSAWMLRKEQYDDKFADDEGTPLVIVPHWMNAGESSLQPFAFKFDQASPELLRDYLIDSQTFSQEFTQPHIGFKTALQQFDETRQKELIYERLRDAVNRHTNWYASAWNDGLGTEKSTKDQAYSPFVASSYEPSESDNFTACGITVQCPPDGFKHWMFVFRIKGKNWYTTQHASEGKEINFDEMWFDETSLGTTGLAKREKAWDRLGTAMEDELIGGAILYLHNITADGQVTADGKLPENNQYQPITLSDKAVKVAERYVENKQEPGAKALCFVFKDQGQFKIQHGFKGPDDNIEIYNTYKVDFVKGKKLADISAPLTKETMMKYPYLTLTRKEYFKNGKKQDKTYMSTNNKFGNRSYVVTPTAVDSDKVLMLYTEGKHIKYLINKETSKKYISAVDNACSLTQKQMYGY